MTDRFTDCPGGCPAVVVVHENNQINYCCAFCWQWYFRNGMLGEVPMLQVGDDWFELPRHTAQCDRRQSSRSGVVVEEGEFTVKPGRNAPQT